MSENSQIPKELTALRDQIDTLDDKIVALFIERASLVAKVGEMKRRSNPGQCPIRSSREAEVIKRITQKFEGQPFLPAAAAAIWRIVIGASTAIEGALTLSVFTADTNDYYWLSREYFGLFVPTIKQSQVKRVIGDVIDGKASVGIVPMLKTSDTSYWWVNLAGRGENSPKIFACLPYVYHGTPSRDASSCLAIATIEPEESGDDRSIFVIEANQNFSQTKLQMAFSNAKLEATWISIATLSPNVRHHLIEIKGFVNHHHPAIKQLVSSGASNINVSWLGAYAAPIVLKALHPHSETSSNQPPRHASKSS